MEQIKAGKATLYDILEIQWNASEGDIKKAYRKLAMRYHPDLHGGSHKEKFIIICTAYKILINPEKRRIYDETGTWNDIFDHNFKEDDKKQKAFSMLSEIFHRILSDKSNDIKCVNLSKSINNFLINRKKSIKSSIHEVEETIKDYLDILDGIDYDGDEENNIFETIILQEIKDMKDGIRKAEEDLKITDEAFEVLKDYRFKDPVIQPTNNSNNNAVFQRFFIS